MSAIKIAEEIISDAQTKKNDEQIALMLEVISDAGIRTNAPSNVPSSDETKLEILSESDIRVITKNVGKFDELLSSGIDPKLPSLSVSGLSVSSKKMGAIPPKKKNKPRGRG